MAALVERGTTVFLARRSAGSRHGGLWELPGGKVESGEDPRAALVREIREELGIAVACLGEPGRYRATLDGRDFLFLVFRVEFDSDPRIMSAHDAWSYVDVEKLGSFALAPLDGPALDDWAAKVRGENRG